MQLNRTPLHYAAALSEELTDFLKESGADADAKDAVSCCCTLPTESKHALINCLSSSVSLKKIFFIHFILLVLSELPQD